MVPIDEVSTIEGDLLDVYSACYSGWGGFPVREVGYWRRALASHIFVEIPYEAFDLVLVRGASQLSAYAIAGTRERETVVLESAASRAAEAMALWQAVETLATSRNSNLISIQMGQASARRSMIHCSEPDFRRNPGMTCSLGRLWRPSPCTQPRFGQQARGQAPTFEIWTPERSLRLGPGEPSLLLEMKESDLHRLLLRRLGLETAVREQRVTVRTGGWDQIRRVASVLAPIPWVYHHLDYV